MIKNRPGTDPYASLLNSQLIAMSCGLKGNAYGMGCVVGDGECGGGDMSY